MIPYINIHTHHLSKDNGVFLFNYRFGFDKEIYLEKHFSIGIHPWDADIQVSMSELEKIIQLSSCLAIGECGIDKLKGPDLEVQKKIFISQLELAVKYQKPVIIHCVKAFEELIELCSNYHSKTPLIIHGFNKSVQLAKQLIDKGFYLSLNSAILKKEEFDFSNLLIEKLFLETDNNESLLIEDVYQRAATCFQIPENDLKEKIILISQPYLKTMEDKHWMQRTRLLVGDSGIDNLQKAHVLIVGLGGVGSYAAEALCRAGIGELTIVDGDVVDPTNRNRQLQALSTTHGISKAKLMEERMLQINPSVKLNVISEFQDPEKMIALLQKPFDYVIDAIDSITPKVHLIKTALEMGHRLVSSMGAGGKMDPTQLKVLDISKTCHCPMAYYLRKRLKEVGIKKGFKAVFSTELPDKKSIMRTDGTNFKKSAYGTISYIPAVFGMTCASVVIRDLTDWKEIK